MPFLYVTGCSRRLVHCNGNNFMAFLESRPGPGKRFFSWAEGTCNVGGLTNGKIVELERGQSAMMDLGRLLQAAFVGLLRWRAPLNEFPCKVFGSNRDPTLALMGAKELEDSDMREIAIWRKCIDAHVFEAGGYGVQHNEHIWGELGCW
jgi:hypothetical protein